MKWINQNRNKHWALLALQCAMLILIFFNKKNDIPLHRLLYIGVGIGFAVLIIVLQPFLKKGIELYFTKPIVREIGFHVLLVLFCCGILFSFDLVNVRSITFGVFRTLSNVVVLYFILLLLYLLCGRAWIAVCILSVLSYIFNVAVYEVYIFRGIPIAPWDIYAIGTAADVAGNYEIFFDEYMVYAWIITMIMQQLSLVFDRKRSKKELLPSGVVLVVLGCCYALLIYPRLYGYLWDVNQAYIEEGLVSGFAAHISYAQYKKPKAYSREHAMEILQSHSSQENGVLVEGDGTKAKNIIVIMNESFADLSCLGNALEYDYMPFIHGMSENVVKGNLIVPVFGGGTSNTEFEVLTGNTCAFNLQSPYETVIRGDINSIVRNLQRQGFYCEAYHPGEPQSWKRDKVYEWMGFEKFDNNTEIPPDDTDMIGRFASDAYDYQQIISHFENRDKTKPYFLFNVTIQNHGGYDYERQGLTLTREAEAYHNYSDVEEYLALVQESDKQLESLIQYFEKESEPTVICFFGDHLPALQDEFLVEQQGESYTSHSRYMTPLLIWTNYDIEETDLGEISANYIMPLLLNVAGAELSDYDRFLLDLYKEYPVISTSGVDDVNGMIHTEIDSVDNTILDEYKMIEYMELKDWAE